MLTAKQVEFFHQNGYLNAGKLLEPGEVAMLRDRLDAVLAGESDTGGKVEYAEPLNHKDPAQGGVLQVVNIWKQDSLFRKHHSRPPLVEMARQLTGSQTLRIFHDQILSKPPRNGRPVAWHQDYGYWQMVTPADLITCWVALDDATIENGCMQVVPGSHTWGLQETNTDLGNDDHEALLKHVAMPAGAKVEKVAIELPAGHCMWHHCLTLHGTDVNRTPRPRRAVITHLMPGHCRYNAKFEHLMAKYAQSNGLHDGEILCGEHFPEV